LIKKLFDKTFLKYVLVGAVNTVVGTGVMFAAYNWAGLSYWVSSALNYIVGSIVSYILNKNFTFENKERGWKPVLRFTANIAVCYGIAYGIAKPLTMAVLSGYTVNIQENIAMLVGMGLFIILNYFGQRFFAFKAEDEGERG